MAIIVRRLWANPDTGLLAFVTMRITQTEYQLTLDEWKAGSVAGVFNSVGTIFLLYAMRLPATMAFPISAIIAIIGGVALTSLVYKERLDRYKISGILFGLAALCLTVFREQIAEAANALLLQQ